MPSVFLLQSHYFDLKIKSFQIPAASMNLFDTISILLLIQLMELAVYPLFRYLEVQLTTLRRMGFGLFLITLSMVYAAVLEPHRRNHVDYTKTNVILNTKINCSSYTVFWQAPQFALIGFSEFFTSISGKLYQIIYLFLCSQKTKHTQVSALKLYIYTYALFYYFLVINSIDKD